MLDEMMASDLPWALRELIAQQRAEGEQLYWLLDQSALPQSQWIARHIGGADWIDLLSGESERHFNGASPIIVDAFGASEHASLRLADELYRVGRFANAISLITSPLPIARLQAEMHQSVRIDLPGNLEAMLRYFDTRSLPLLPRLLLPQQYAALLQGIKRWSYLDRWGAMRHMPTVALSNTSTLVPSRIALDEAQEAALIDDGLTDAVIDLLLTQGHPALLDLSPPAQFEAIDPLVIASRGFGLGEPFETLAFVGKALGEGIEFSHGERWRGLLSAYRGQRSSLDEVFA